MKRKSILRSLAVFFTVLVISMNISAASIDRADAEDIEMLLSAASGVNSAYWASYIGTTRGRVYIEYETAIHFGSFFSDEMKRVVYWLPVKKLSEEKLKKFIEYKETHERNRK